MTNDQFWELIETSRDEDCNQHAENLLERLVDLGAEEIIAFDQIFSECLTASDRYDLYAVAYIINQGCSSESFVDFQNWLIAKGRSFYEAALQNPERAAYGVEPDGPETYCDAIGVVALESYEWLTGEELPPQERNTLQPTTTQGEKWDWKDLPTLYPALCEKFGW